MKPIFVLFFFLSLCGNVGYAAMSKEAMRVVVRAEKDLRIAVLRKMHAQALQARMYTVISVEQPTQKPLATPLHDACLYGDSKAFDALMADENDAKVLDGSGATPLHYVVGSPFLVKPKANDSEEAKKTYAEQCAIRCEMIRALFRAGADLRACDNMGASPMDYAQEGKHDALVECLKKLITINGHWNAKE